MTNALRLALALTLTAPLAVAAAPAPAPADQSRPVRLGQWTQLDRVRIRPDAVVEDSRCPINARCVWAGRATVRATVQIGRRVNRMKLTLGEPVRIAGGELALVSLEPGKVAGSKTPPTAYRAAFEFRR